MKEKEKQKEKSHKMKINGLIDVALWENIPCKCNHDLIEKQYPLIECMHCKCKQAWDSVPQEHFKINNVEKGKKTGTTTIKEITLVRGRYEDVIGWRF